MNPELPADLGVNELNQRSPEWVAAWRAEQALNRRIRELCEERGWQFMPFEPAPWEVGDEMPEYVRAGLEHATDWWRCVRN
jgi:hypothetical protein